MTHAVDGLLLLNYCFERKAVLVGKATHAPVSAREFVFVFPPSSRRHSSPGVTSQFVKTAINDFYPHVNSDFKEHVVTLPVAFALRDSTITKVVQLQDSDHQYRLDHSPLSFCFSYSHVWRTASQREIFGGKVYVNTDHA